MPFILQVEQQVTIGSVAAVLQRRGFVLRNEDRRTNSDITITGSIEHFTNGSSDEKEKIKERRVEKKGYKTEAKFNSIYISILFIFIAIIATNVGPIANYRSTPPEPQKQSIENTKEPQKQFVENTNEQQKQSVENANEQEQQKQPVEKTKEQEQQKQPVEKTKEQEQQKQPVEKTKEQDEKTCIEITVITLNMGTSTTHHSKWENRLKQLVAKAEEINPDLIVLQEVKNRDIKLSGFDFYGKEEVRVGFNNGAFKLIKKIDDVRESLNAGGEKVQDELKNLIERMSACLLQSTGSNPFYYLVISYHGRYKIKDDDKAELIAVLQRLTRKLLESQNIHHDVPIIIGGDFNYDITNAYSKLTKGFDLEGYIQTLKRQNKKTIDYFMVYGGVLVNIEAIPIQGADHDLIKAIVEICFSKQGITVRVKSTEIIEDRNDSPNCSEKTNKNQTPKKKEQTTKR